MSQERTRFPITPQERHESAKSSDQAVPERRRPHQEARLQDKPLPPDAPDAGEQDKPLPPDAPDAPDARDRGHGE